MKPERFTAVLLYDGATVEKHRPHIADAVAAEGGTLSLEPQAGAQDIAHDFKQRLNAADVVVVDVSTESLDIGFEIGRYIRLRDQRVIAVTFVEGRQLPDKLAFYLRRINVVDLGDVLAGGPRAADQKRRLRFEIRNVVEKQPSGRIPRYRRAPEDDSAALSALTESDVVLRAPTAAYVFGEFAVTLGHPALYLPLPRYVYVGVRHLPSHAPPQVVYRTINDRGDTTDTPLISDPRELTRVIREVEPKHPRLEVIVYNQLPTRCGLGTSSALSSCLALYLAVRSGSVRDLQVSKLDEEPGRNLLEPGTPFERVFRTSWRIDSIFHSERGSGAGSFASLAGTRGPNPLLFLSAARKTWEGDHGDYPWNLIDPSAIPTSSLHAADGISSLPCFGFRTHPAQPKIAEKPWHFALVYTGAGKDTAWSMTNLERTSGYFTSRADMLRAIVGALRDAGGTFAYSVAPRLTESYFGLLESTAARGGTSDQDVIDEHVRISISTLLNAYGNAALVGINSFWSQDDDRFLTLMEACQAILDALGVSEIWRQKERHFEPSCLAHVLNRTRDSRGRRVLGAKITGGGCGGDLMVMSNLSDPREFERTLGSSLSDAKDVIMTNLDDFARVHFSTSWEEGYPSTFVAEGTRILRGQ